MMQQNSITLNDPSLRDGNHAVQHRLSTAQIRAYCQAADQAGIDIVEVGHGNGLGASSCLLGRAAESDTAMLSIARAALTRSRLGVHFIPGFGRIKDLQCAFDLGVDVYRLACHCTEANITGRYIQAVKQQGKTAYGVLMMSHMASAEKLAEQAALMKSYGADAIILMDSAGHYLPRDVSQKIGAIRDRLEIPTGFHAHNNLGLAIANSLAAAEAGATILDGCSKGFGAGAGNAQLEVLVSVLSRSGYLLSTTLEQALALAETAEQTLVKNPPRIERTSILSGCYGLFSGFARQVQQQAARNNISEYQLYRALAGRKLVAGQEDIILEVAQQLARSADPSLAEETDVPFKGL